jgi:ketosteroid isomerase-like protein
MPAGAAPKMAEMLSRRPGTGTRVAGRMGEHPNVTLVREGFRHVAEGDVEGMAQLWAEGLVYYAFDASGHPAEYNSREEALDIVRVGQQMLKQHSYQLVDVRAIGTELVFVHARVHMAATKAAGEDVVDTDYAAVYRVKDGKIISCCDFIDSTTEGLLDRAWS